MISLLANLMTLADPEQINDLDLNCMENLNGHIYWKDLNGRYLGSNNFKALSGQKYYKGSDLLGHTDFDLNWSSRAPMLKQNDLEIIIRNEAKLINEPTILADGSIRNIFSYKFPLRTHAKKVIGIMGISLPLKIDDFISLNVKTNQNTASHQLVKVSLTKCQMDCLFYLVNGMTMKQIAITIGRSPKAVEHILEAVKVKLKCYTRSELIATALNLPFIMHRLFNSLR